MTAALLNHRYRILRSLAEGGFGKTFLAEDTQMPSRRKCVIKQLKPMSGRPNIFAIIQQRFTREAAVLESVSKGSDQIPDLYAYFSEDDQFYLVQEWIEGQPLSALDQNLWTEARVSRLLIDALTALSHVHRQNIIHRDIKPDNIILRASDQRPCLIDFGAVKEVMSTVVNTSGLPNTSIVIGTPGFMPPEQAAGRPTFASDIYSLSMTAIYLLTGRSPTEIPTDISNGRLLWQQYAPKLGPRFTSILTRAIHPHPQTRFATASDMLAALAANESVSKTGAPLRSVTTFRSSAIPTVAAAPLLVSTSRHQTGHAQTGKATVINASPIQKRALISRWQRLGLATGALILGAGIIAGLRPQLSFQNRTSEATLGDFQTQISRLEKTIKAEPGNDVAQVELARIYKEVGQYDEAIAQIKPVIAQSPANATALTVKGDAEFATGSYESAIQTTTQAISQGNPSATTYNLRGDAYYEKGEYDKAIDDYRSAIRLDSDNGLAYLNWSAVNSIRGNAQESLQNLNLAIEKDPSLMSAWVNRGSRKAETNDRLGAAQDWQQAISMPATTASEYASRGYAKSRMGNKNGAVDDYNQALIINPKLVRGYTNRAAVFYERGEKEQALSELEKALAINPNSVSALIFKGEIKSFQTNPDPQSAITAYSKALDVNPNDPDVLNNRCGTYFATQQFDLALTDCNLGLQINPRSGSLYNGRGNIRLNQNNYEGAIQDYSRAIDIFSETGREQSSQSAYSNRASALLQIQDLGGALSDVNKALVLKPDAPEDYYKRGLIKATQGDRAAAGADMRKAADLYIKQGRTDGHKNVMAMIDQLGL